MNVARPLSGIRKIEGAFIESPVDGELMLLNVATGAFSGLKGVGLAIWGALDKTDDPETIKSMLTERYDVTPATCDHEVEGFLGALVEAGLLART